MDTITLRSRFALIMTILIAPFAGVSAAGLIDLNSGYSGSADASGALNATGRAADATVRNTTTVNTSGSANAGASANVRANASSSAGTNNAGGNGSADVTTGPNGGVTVDAGNSGNIIKIDRSSDEVSHSLGANISADNVATQADLKTFAAAQLRNDENFQNIDIESDHLALGYKQPARFLGFIPVNMDVTVTVNQDGTLDVHYPWYSFLSVSNKADLETALQTEVSAYVAAHAASNVATGTSTTTAGVPNTGVSGFTFMTPSAEASLIARIAAVLKSHVVSGSGNASSTQSSSY